MRLERDGAVKSTTIINMQEEAHKKGWPHYTTTYRIRGEGSADS
jgi:hypothetical protein